MVCAAERAAVEMTVGDCPRCGCNDVEILERITRWGDSFARAQCGHCGKQFSGKLAPPRRAEDDEPTVYYRPAVKPRCPDCGGGAHVVSKAKDSRIRRHKCQQCGLAFKSIERG